MHILIIDFFRILCGIWPRSHLVHLQHDGIYRMSKYGKETARLRDFYHRMLEKVIDNRLKEIGGDLYEPSEGLFNNKIKQKI